MKKWEYKILDSKDVPRGGLLKGRRRDTLETYLNDLGTQGWEIVNIGFREWGSGRVDFSGVAKREKQ